MNISLNLKSSNLIYLFKKFSINLFSHLLAMIFFADFSPFWRIKKSD